MSATYPAGAVAVYGETLSLSTTLASLGVPRGYQQALIYAPASNFRLHINPGLLDAVFYDASAASGSQYKQTGGDGVTLVYDLTDRTQIGAGGSGTLLDSAQTGDRLYLCFSEPISGMRVDVQSANGEASVLTVNYRKNDDTWATTSATDGTASGGATLAVDGSITWTAVTDWRRAQLVGPQGIVTTAGEKPTREGFWLQLVFSAALGADVEVDEIWALNYDTSRGYFRAGVEYSLSLDRRVIGAIEAILASGTETLDITWVKV